MNKSKTRILVIGLVLAMTLSACKQSPTMNEKPAIEDSKDDITEVEKHKDVEPDDKKEHKEGKVSLEYKHFKDEDKLREAKKDINYIYEAEGDLTEALIIKPDFNLGDVYIKELEFKDDKLVDKEEIAKYVVGKDESLIIVAPFPEGIPIYKVEWEVNGKKDEYILQYNGKDGMDTIKPFEYK